MFIFETIWDKEDIMYAALNLRELNKLRVSDFGEAKGIGLGW